MSVICADSIHPRYTAAVRVSDIITTGDANMEGGLTVAGNVLINDTTASYSGSTGSFVTMGGAGITGELHVDDDVTVHNSGAYTASAMLHVDATGAAVLTAAGDTLSLAHHTNATHMASLSINASGNALFSTTGTTISFRMGDEVHVLETTDTTSTSTGAFQVVGGACIAKKLQVGESVTVHYATASSHGATLAVNASGIASIDTTGNEVDIAATDTFKVLCVTNASSTTTGAFQVAGGVAVGMDVVVGGGLYLPTATGTAAPLNYYETYTNTSVSFAGPWAAPQTAPVVFTRIGNVVTISLAVGTAAAAANVVMAVAAAGSVPARFCPLANAFLPINVIDNSLVKLGTLKILTDGTMTIYVGGDTAFTNAGNTGIPRTSATYSVAL